MSAGGAHPASPDPRGEPDEAGAEPDPRFTLANERTFLAWNRTALALIGGGLAVARFLDVGGAGLRLVVAIPLIALGGAASLASFDRWRRSERALRLAEPLPRARLPLLLVVGVVVVALGAVALAVVGAVEARP